MRLTYSLVLATAGLAFAAFTGAVAQEAQKATCPVSGQEFTVTEKTRVVQVNGGAKLSFCCENCPKAFAADPEKFVKQAGNCPMNPNGAAKVSRESRVVLNNDLYYFCCANCPNGFKANPVRVVKQTKDPVTGKSFAPTADSPRVERDGQIYLFAGAESKAEFDKDPAKYVLAYAK